jgi:hypothetical protein
MQSRPPRARGLKLVINEDEKMTDVAPPAGAWIETSHKRRRKNDRRSRPPRARGLKQKFSDK